MRTRFRPASGVLLPRFFSGSPLAVVVPEWFPVVPGTCRFDFVPGSSSARVRCSPFGHSAPSGPRLGPDSHAKAFCFEILGVASLAVDGSASFLSGVGYWIVGWGSASDGPVSVGCRVFGAQAFAQLEVHVVVNKPLSVLRRMRGTTKQKHSQIGCIQHPTCSGSR